MLLTPGNRFAPMRTHLATVPARNPLQFLEFAQLPLSIAAVRSSLETAGDGWRRLETAGDGWRRVEMAETGGDGVYWSATVM